MDMILADKASELSDGITLAVLVAVILLIVSGKKGN